VDSRLAIADRGELFAANNRAMTKINKAGIRNLVTTASHPEFVKKQRFANLNID
jgi:hypothetical protein